MLFKFFPSKASASRGTHNGDVVPLPSASCYGHIPVQGDIPPSPPSPLSLQLGPFSCCLHTILCPPPCESLQLPQGPAGLRNDMACGPAEGSLVRDGAVAAAAEQGVQPQAVRWPRKGSHLLSSQRSHDVSATGFSIMELLGGRVGVTHTPSRAAQGSERSGSALGNGGTIPGPWHRQQNPAAVSPWGWGGAEGPWALTARGHARLMGTGRRLEPN